MPNRVRDLTGQRFGRLVVTHKAKDGAQGVGVTWSCLCDCGNNKEVRSGNLCSGRVQSCGCLVPDSTRAYHHSMKGDLVGYNKWYYNYKIKAKERNIEFNVSLDQMTEIGKQDCHYCGAEPVESRTGGSGYRIQSRKRGSFNEEYYKNLCVKVNGIDRVDNTRGYEPGNIVACCKQCNIAKRDHSVDDFLAWARRLVAEQERKALKQS